MTHDGFSTSIYVQGKSKLSFNHVDLLKGVARIFSRVGQRGIFRISRDVRDPILRIYMVKIRKIAEPEGSAPLTPPPADASIATE